MLTPKFLRLQLIIIDPTRVFISLILEVITRRNPMRIISCLVLLAGHAVSLNCNAQQGFPEILNFSPKEYRSNSYTTSPQNWGVIEDDMGRILVANTNGVLAFDGLHWQMVGGTQDLWFFKFAKDDDGRIYTGGIGEIGYFSANDRGEIQFISLKEKLPEDVADFNRIFSCVESRGKIYFRSNQYLIEWDGKEFNYWKSKSKFLQVLSSGQWLYAYQQDGLYRFQEGQLVKLFDDPIINDLRVKGILEMAGEENPDLLLISSKQGIFKVEKGKSVHQPSRLDSMVVFNCSETSNGNLAIGTNGNGMFILDATGDVKAGFDSQSRLLGNQVVYPYEDSHSGLWAALFNGVSRINHRNRVTTIEKDHGLESFASAITQFDGVMYVGTLGGYYILEGENNERVSVSRGDGISNGVLDFFSIDEKNFALTESGVSEILDADAKLLVGIENSGAILLPKKSPGRAYVASHNGAIHRVEFDTNGWTSKGVIATLGHQVWSLEEDESGSIWAAYDGLSKVDFDPVLNEYQITEIDSTKGLDSEMGLIEVAQIHGKAVFGTGLGLFEYDERSGQLVRSDVLGDAIPDGEMVYNLTETRSGDVWITTETHTGVIYRLADGTTKYDSLPLITTGISDVWSIFEDDQQRVWIGGTEALVCYDPKIERSYDQPFNTLIHTVRLAEDSIIFHGYYSNDSGYLVADQPDRYITCLPFRYNDITFQFSAPFFEGMELTKFSFKLEGQNENWSTWSSSTVKEYTNLAGGDYVFRVKARNAYGKIGQEASYRFSIEYPWYLRPWAYVCYILFAILLIWIAVRIATYRLKQSKIVLEKIVSERTSEIRQNMTLLEKQKEEIDVERKKSDQLLLNILPKETAAELKEKGTADTRKFDSVSVLFTDFKNFTKISESLSADEIVNEINICFSAFDGICDKFGLEKVKTIGDSYMCAGGLPVPNETHPLDIVNAAMDMQAFIHQRKTEKKAAAQPYFEMRCGIHTGPVIAGVVGVKKFQYDIWGDTVNLASRMESSGEIGKVNISESTYHLVKDRVNCTFRGEVEAKNKGKVKMYFVDGLKP